MKSDQVDLENCENGDNNSNMEIDSDFDVDLVALRRQMVDETIKSKRLAEKTMINYDGIIKRFRTWGLQQIPSINIEVVDENVAFYITDFMFVKSKEQGKGYQTTEAIYNAVVNYYGKDLGCGMNPWDPYLSRGFLLLLLGNPAKCDRVWDLKKCFQRESKNKPSVSSHPLSLKDLKNLNDYIDESVMHVMEKLKVMVIFILVFSHFCVGLVLLASDRRGGIMSFR